MGPSIAGPLAEQTSRCCSALECRIHRILMQSDADLLQPCRLITGAFSRQRKQQHTPPYTATKTCNRWHAHLCCTFPAPPRPGTCQAR